MNGVVDGRRLLQAAARVVVDVLWQAIERDSSATQQEMIATALKKLAASEAAGIKLKATKSQPTTITAAPAVLAKASPRKVSGSKVRRQRQRRLREVRPSSSAGMSNIDWPRADSFDTNTGKQKVIEFIEKTWSYQKYNLDYEVEHLYTAQLTKAKRFKYRVCWSWQDTRRPSSRSTSCVYFNIDVPAVEDGATQPVQVTYTFQKDKLLHRPGRSRYHQTFLAELQQQQQQQLTSAVSSHSVTSAV